MNLNGDANVQLLVEEKDEWKKKYEAKEAEYLTLQKKLKEYEEKGEHTDCWVNSKEDVIMKYEYLKNECDFLNVKVNILTLEKEEELRNKKRLENTILKQSKEIEGYKKILDKIRSMNLTFKPEETDTTSKINYLNDTAAFVFDENLFLKELVKVNTKLNEVNNQLNDKLKDAYETYTHKLQKANEQIQKYCAALNELKKGYIQHNAQREVILSQTIEQNKKLKEELEKKRNAEILNLKEREKRQQVNTNNILLHYYEMKYKLNEMCKTLILKYMQSITNRHIQNTSNSPNEETKIIFFDMQYMTEKNAELYEQEMNTLKNKMCKGDDIFQIKKKINEFVTMSLLQNTESAHKYLEIYLLKKINTNEIAEIIYCNIKLINDIYESFSASLALIFFIYDTYIVDIIDNINNTTYITNLGKGYIRFYIYFFVTLSNFFLAILKYLVIIRNNDPDDYVKLFQLNYIFLLFCLSKFTIEKYIDKIRMKVFSTNLDYSILNVLTNRLNFIYNSFFISHDQNSVQDPTTANYTASGKNTRLKNKNEANASFSPSSSSSVNGLDTTQNEKETRKNNRHINGNKSIMHTNNNSSSSSSSMTTKMGDEDSSIKDKTTSLELFCYINFLIGSSIMIITDADTLFDFSSEMNMNIYKEILHQCVQLIPLLKIQKKIANVYFSITTCSFPTDKFKQLVMKYKKAIKFNDEESNSPAYVTATTTTTTVSMAVSSISSVQKGEPDLSETNKEGEINKKKKKGTEYSLKVMHNISSDILSELQTMINTAGYFVFKTEKLNTLSILDICEKYVELYINITTTQRNNELDKKIIQQKEKEIKMLTREVQDFKGKIDFFKKKINMLIIKEEKCNKLEIDLDNLKNEKNEYLNIIQDLRKNKNDQMNEIAYIKKLYNEAKHKYTELSKSLDSQRKHYSNTKTTAHFNIDIYYMKNIIRNLYYDNFLTKLNKSYYLYDSKYDYYNKKYKQFSRFNEQNDENTTDYFDMNEENILQTATIENRKKETNIFLKTVLGDENYFSDKENDTALFDDIYRCELVKKKLLQNTRKHNFHQTFMLPSSITPPKKEQSVNVDQIYAIVEKYKNLKNEIIKELANMSLTVNPEQQIQNSAKTLEDLYTKLNELKNWIHECYPSNQININEEKAKTYKILNIIINKDMNAFLKTKLKPEKAGTGSNSIKEKSTEPVPPHDIILNKQSLSYLVKNIFNLS